VVEDPFLEPPQLLTRLEAELVGEQRSPSPVDVERLRLAARLVEREHQLGAAPLSQWLLAHERLQLRKELGVAAELEVRVDPLLDRRGPFLFELRAFRAGDRVVEVGERRAAPQAQCLPQLLGGACGVEAARVGDELLEPLEIETAGRDPGEVAGRLRDDRVAADGLPELGDVNLERRRGGVGRRSAPELVDQPVARDDAVRVQQQEREERSLLRASECDRAPVLGSLERAENPVVDARVRLL